MKISFSLAVFASLALLPTADGHGYMFEPSTRNYYAHSDGLVFGSAAGVPEKEYCQHCLNSNAGVCGISESGTDYDAWLDSQGNPMPWITQRTYEPGQVIEVHSHLASNHAGHMELRGCPDGKDSTEECFAQHVFHFVEDIAYHLPADPAHPERGYYWGGQQANGSDFAMKFRIPASLSGARVLLQWRYITANTCSPPGYAEYFGGQNSFGEVLPDEFWSPGVSECSLPYPLDGTRSNVWPEQFVNCAEVAILGDAGGPTTPTPVSPAPTEAPVESTEAPSNQITPSPDTSAPTSKVTSSPVTGAPTSLSVPSQPPQMDNSPTDNPNSGEEACCSQDFKTCASWCSESQEVCESCGMMVWLPEGPVEDSSCLPRWSTCTNNQNGCCDGLICRGDQYYMQCQHPNEGGIITDPVEPTDAPVPQVTPSPVTGFPTSSPVTGAPTRQITPSPVTGAPTRQITPSPVTGAPTSLSVPTDNPNSGEEACCSQDFKTCASWCSESQEVCESCGMMVWLPEGPVEDSSCLPRWSTCTNNQNGCCDGLICRGDQYYMQCQHPNEGGIITDPVEPTDAPVPQVTPPPVPVEATEAPVSQITPSPVVATPPPPTGHVGDDSRLVAFLGNWQSCPSDAQIAPYTHIIVSFAVTYDWPVSNFDACQIRTNVPICGNSNRQDLVDHWRSLGKKVLVSFGGANMGGTWMGSGGQPWDACYGKEESIVQQLHDIVLAQNFDGVDIDYEYFYDTPARKNFLIKITQGLKVGLGSAPKLPTGQDEVSHAPMENALRPGQAYFDILTDNAMHVDFLMPQYYNAYTYPARDGLTAVGSAGYSALSHYKDMVNGIFAGDATSVVFGFCVTQCGTFNANGVQAASVMSELATHYPCNGGAFFWVAADDLDSSWSNPVSEALEQFEGCSADSTFNLPPWSD